MPYKFKSAKQRVLPNATQPAATADRAAFWKYCVRASGAARVRAANGNFPGTVTSYDIDQLLVDQQWRCAVSGIAMVAPGTASDFNQHPFGPSLDRIVPKLGYVPGNLRVVCTIVNAAMNEWGLENFQKLIDAIRQGGAR